MSLKAAWRVTCEISNLDNAGFLGFRGIHSSVRVAHKETYLIRNVEEAWISLSWNPMVPLTACAGKQWMANGR